MPTPQGCFIIFCFCQMVRQMAPNRDCRWIVGEVAVFLLSMWSRDKGVFVLYNKEALWLRQMGSGWMSPFYILYCLTERSIAWLTMFLVCSQHSKIYRKDNLCLVSEWFGFKKKTVSCKRSSPSHWHYNHRESFPYLSYKMAFIDFSEDLQIFLDFNSY